MFFLCLLSLGESKIRYPHRHSHRDHYVSNGAQIQRKTTDLPMNITGVKTDKTEGVYTVKDLKSLQKIVQSAYPLLVNETLSEAMEKTKYKVDRKQTSFNVEFEIIKVAKEGKELKAVFNKGHVDVGYLAMTEKKEIKRFGTRIFHTRTEHVPRPLTDHEVKIIFDIVKEKIHN